MTGKKIYIKNFGWDYIDLLDWRGQENGKGGRKRDKLRKKYTRIANGRMRRAKIELE